MQGIVADQNGAYVKAAILKLIKLKVIRSELDTDDGIVEDAEMESVTYVEADDEGRFVIQDLNSEEKYIIEIFVEKKESEKKEPEALTIIPESDCIGTIEPEEDSAAAEMTEAEDPVKDEEIREPDTDSFEEEAGTEDFQENLLIDVIDSVTPRAIAENAARDNLYVKDQYNLSNIKDKLYMRKTNLW